MGQQATADTAGEKPDAAGADQTEEATVGKRGRFRVRIPSPRTATRRAAKATRAWSRRPSGRLALSGLFLLTLVATAGTAGAVLVPATAKAPKPNASSPTPSASATDGSIPGGLPPQDPVTSPNPTGLSPTGGSAHPLADWAQQTGKRVDIPAVAMQAYGYTELVLSRTTPSCRLSWTTLAAIGKVESAHGSFNGARLDTNGVATPAIIGQPLDGKDGRQRIIDTDDGQLDGDQTYDRAVGPMQFLPATWQEFGTDADSDGRKDPHDLDDAALAAGKYLCKGGRNLTIAADWWSAILSYNNLEAYAQDVFNAADEYGRSSRT